MRARVAIACMLAGAAVMLVCMAPEHCYYAVGALFLLVVYLATKLTEQARKTAAQAERADAWEASSTALREVGKDYQEIIDKWHAVTDTQRETLQMALSIAEDLERSTRAKSPAADKLNVN
jgi:cation transport ATPase